MLDVIALRDEDAPEAETLGIDAVLDAFSDGS
jgi:hypothetical protein